MKRIATIGLIAVAALGATACSTGPNTPDEFRVVKKAPLTIPPDFNLRPPAPGESRPQDLTTDAQARMAVFGADLGQGATDGEKAFIKRAGGEATDRSVRSEVDYDSTQVLRKNRSFADQILNFGRPRNANDPVLDAAAEQARLQAEKDTLADITGNKDVVIKRHRAGKLPGL